MGGESLNANHCILSSLKILLDLLSIFIWSCSLAALSISYTGVKPLKSNTVLMLNLRVINFQLHNLSFILMIYLGCFICVFVDLSFWIEIAVFLGAIEFVLGSGGLENSYLYKKKGNIFVAEYMPLMISSRIYLSYTSNENCGISLKQKVLWDTLYFVNLLGVYKAIRSLSEAFVNMLLIGLKPDS